MLSSCKPAKNILYFCARFVTRKNLFTLRNWKREIVQPCIWEYRRGLINTRRPGNAYMRAGSPLVQVMAYHWFNIKRLPEPRATFRPKEHITLKHVKKLKCFHSRKYIRKYRLQNGGLFLSTSNSYPFQSRAQFPVPKGGNHLVLLLWFLLQCISACHNLFVRLCKPDSTEEG